MTRYDISVQYADLRNELDTLRGITTTTTRENEELRARIEALRAERDELRAAIRAFVEAFRVEEGFHEDHFQLSVQPNTITGFRGPRAEILKRLLVLSTS